MKNILNKIAVIVALATTATAQVQAYSYTITNLTKDEIGVGMRYYGLGEPRYFRWIPKEFAGQFTPNQPVAANERGIEGRKIGFVAKTWWYVRFDKNAENYQQMQALKADHQSAKNLPWEEIQITWLPTESYKLAAKLGKTLTDFSMAAGQIVVDIGLAAAAAAAAPETGGVSLAAITAGQAVDKSTLFNTLGSVIKAAGSLAARSMMTDRQITIVDTPEGIKFICQL